LRKRQSSSGRERITHLQSEGSSVRAVLDQQSKDDRKQDEEKKPSFHASSVTLVVVVSILASSQFRITGQPVFLKMRRSGRELATGAFEANGNHFDQ
jgi:hypothetical protein